MSTAKAQIRDEWPAQGVRVLVGVSHGDGAITHTLSWGGGITQTPVDEAVDMRADDGLFLPNDVARAVYEALADHFGHSGHDTRALRRDYEAERGRVDKMLANLIERAL